MAIELEALARCAYVPETQRKTASTKVTSRKKKLTRPLSTDESDGVPFTSQFAVEVRFLGGLSQSQMDIFDAAASRWSQIIVGDLPRVQLPTGEIVDDLLIEAQGVLIDGVGGILGRAGPTILRANSIPAKGIMEFDTADLQRMETDGSLLNVIIHEMAHVVGIGTIWDDLGVIAGCPTANPVFLGQNAIVEFGELTGSGSAPVPVANTGGRGTRCGHWRESVFGNELMTGFLNAGSNPISRMTIASLEDLGYEVNYAAAEPYSLPSSLQLALMGIGADGHRQQCQMCSGGARPIQPVALPESAYVD